MTTPTGSLVGCILLLILSVCLVAPSMTQPSSSYGENGSSPIPSQTSSPIPSPTPSSPPSSTPPSFTRAEVRVLSQFTWHEGLISGSPNLGYSGTIWSSPDLCDNGNGGKRGITLAQCSKLCINVPRCGITFFFPEWFGGLSACFGVDRSMVGNVSNVTVSGTPIIGTDQGSYLGIKVYF
jgi:hypothetical protein